MSDAKTVPAQLNAEFECPRCKTWQGIEFDLEDYSNIGFGVMLEEYCQDCNQELLVKVY